MPSASEARDPNPGSPGTTTREKKDMTSELIQLNTEMILLKMQRKALREAAPQLSRDMGKFVLEIADTEDRAIKAMQAVIDAAKVSA